MFRGEKTSLFWAGLIILSLAVFVLISGFWSYRNFVPSNWWDFMIMNNLPVIVGTIYFIVLGLVMMKSGVKKSNPQTPVS
jgi:hypothetical protein